MPKLWWSLESRMEWLTVSKVADRSSRESREMWLTPRAARRLFTNLRRAVSVRWPGRKRLLLTRCWDSWRREIFSVISERKGRLETGQYFFKFSVSREVFFQQQPDNSRFEHRGKAACQKRVINNWRMGGHQRVQSVTTMEEDPVRVFWLRSCSTLHILLILTQGGRQSMGIHQKLCDGR